MPTFGKAGDSVVINGINFNSVTAVQFNGVNVTVGSQTGQGQLNVQVPANATTGPITVITTAGTNTTSTNFIVTSGPLITDFSPSGGPVGTEVIINGANFLGTTSVTFNGVAVTSGGITSASQIHAFVPTGATTGPIVVSTTNGMATTSANFVVGAAPSISDFTPTGGPVGTHVTINGQNFNNITSVQFNGISASFSVTGIGVQLDAVVPASATTGPITISTTTGTNTTSTNFTVGSPPSISNFTPATGGPGTQVTINGQNFINGATVVQFNGVTANASVTSTTQISASVPADASTGPVTVITPVGTNTTSTNFFITPGISGFSPTNGVAGAIITITGNNFTSASEVKIGSVTAAYSVDSNTSISMTIPSLAVSGTISVTTPAGIVATSTNLHILPTIASISPTNGAIGDSITINGSGFFNVTNVTFKGLTAEFTVNSVNSITATVPDNATTGPLVVATSEGKATNAFDFVVIPGIKNFTPTQGAGGTNVVITGTSFGNVTSVKFNGVAAQFNIDSPTQITATVPLAASTGKITATDSQGTGTSATDFEVFPSLFIFSLPNNQVIISWSIAASNYSLTFTTNLTGTIVWSPASNLTATVGDQIRTTNDVYPGTNYFFRLQK